MNALLLKVPLSDGLIAMITTRDIVATTLHASISQKYKNLQHNHIIHDKHLFPTRDKKAETTRNYRGLSLLLAKCNVTKVIIFLPLSNLHR